MRGFFIYPYCQSSVEDLAVADRVFPTTVLTTLQTCMAELNLTSAKIDFVCISELTTYPYA